jgi:arylsulfatase A-like enzyme/Flp pilus assembly protein TadD
MRIAAAILLVIGAGGAWWYTSSRAPEQNLPPGALRGYNLLLVTIDTLRVDRVGVYGNRTGLTPTIDRLASEGVRFDAVRAHAPLTLPSHASLMTGRIPPHHGVRDNGTYRLGEAEPTLAAALKPTGYRTAAFVGAFVLDSRFGLARGFDVYDDHYGSRPAHERVEVVERPADDVMTRATAWIRDAGGPWFGWVHVYDPHEPYAPPQPYATTYATAPYDGEVAYVDSALGRMLESLQAAGQLDRTIILVASDHGEGLGDHGERTHGLFAYDSTMRVPVVMWCRDRIRAGVFVEPAGLIDFAPTVLDLLGVSWTAGDGKSLRAPLTGEVRAESEPTAQYFEALNANLTRNWAPLTGIVAGSLKLIDLPVPELYDLEADPSESKNLYARRPDDARRLEQMLDGISRARPAPPGTAIDSETSARLRSLGYVVAQPSSRPRRFTPADDPKNLVTLDSALDEAMQVSGSGNHAAAAAMLEDVIRQRPDLPLAYDRLAFVHRAAGRLDEAIAVLEQSASKGFADPPVLVSLGTMLQEAGRLDRAVQVLEAAVGMNPQDLEARNRLGTTYAQMGRITDAERAFRGVLDVDPRSPEALTNLGVLYLGAGRVEEAKETLRQALNADPTLTGASNALAVALARSGDLAGAVEQWRRLLEQQPDNPDLLYNFGRALLTLNRPAEARPVLERFVATAPPRYATDVEEVRKILARLPR